MLNTLFFDSDDLSDECTGGRREAHVGDLKLELPLDEDDYLMPSPQQSQATTAYMDLIGDSKLAGKHKVIFINMFEEISFSIFYG